MKLGIMQPYFFPYIGYWQLINAVDLFIVYDNIEYTKKGWINRNRILCNGEDRTITIPLKKDSDYLYIKDRYISNEYDRAKLLNQLLSYYKKAPYYNDVIGLLAEIINFDTTNLFIYIFNSIKYVCKYLDIKTPLLKSSDIGIDHGLKGKEKVLALCKACNCCEYINTVGGIDLYDKNEFSENSIKLSFIKSKEIIYKQYGNSFVPNLSIIDVMMFNPVTEIREMLQNYTIF